MTDFAYGDYSRIARMPELRFLGVRSELLILRHPVDQITHQPGRTCFYHVLSGRLRRYPQSGHPEYHDLEPGFSVGLEDGAAHRLISQPHSVVSGNNGTSDKSGEGRVELFAGYVERRHTVIQRLLNAVVVVPADATPHASIIRHCVEAMVIELGRGERSEQIMRRFSEIVQLEMLRFADAMLERVGRVPAKIRKDAALVRAWTAFLGAPQKAWTMAELADIAGLSRTAFFERFKKVLGRSPLDAMREIRVHYAADMLRTTQAPLSEIASLVGYGSDIALLRAFTRQMKMTPGQWRNTSNDDQAPPSDVG